MHLNSDPSNEGQKKKQSPHLVQVCSLAIAVKRTCAKPLEWLYEKQSLLKILMENTAGLLPWHK